MLRTAVARQGILRVPCGRVKSKTYPSLSQVGLGFSSHNLPQSKASNRSTEKETNVRRFHTSKAKSVESPSSPPEAATSLLASYNAPLAKTFFRLKLFSLGSLTLATGLCPALMLAPGSIGMAGRIGLCCTALATSGASTALIAWIGKPYVSRMSLLSGPSSTEQLKRDLPSEDSEMQSIALAREEKPAIQVMTTNWRLSRLETTIYEPGLIRPTKRPFATWELPTTPPSLPLGTEGSSKTITKLVAVTRNIKSGEVIGRWWARWTRDTLSKEGGEWKSDGQCTEEGKVIRHFSIHEELLDEEWQVL